MLKTIDAHCHLEAIPKEELEETIGAAIDSGIYYMVTSPTKLSEWGISKEISRKYREVKYTLGLHPWFLTDGDRNVRDYLREYFSQEVSGVGEIGLDWSREEIPRELQIDVFTQEMNFAVEKNLPVVIHCHRAWNDLMNIIKKTGVPKRGGFVHSANTSVEVMRSLFDMGLSISAGGNTAFNPGRKLIESLRFAYPKHLLIETDSPNMNPLERKKPNRPQNISVNLKNIADLLGVSTVQLAEETTNNAIKIFGEA